MNNKTEIKVTQALPSNIKLRRCVTLEVLYT